MKKVVLTTAIICLVSSFAFGQEPTNDNTGSSTKKDTASVVLQQKLENLLVEQGILIKGRQLDDETAKRLKKKQKKDELTLEEEQRLANHENYIYYKDLRKLLLDRRFTIPEEFKKSTIKDSFPMIGIDALMCRIIWDKDINSLKNQTGLDFSAKYSKLPDKDTENSYSFYRLNYTSDNLFEGKLDAELGIDLPFYQNKLYANAEKNDNQKYSFGMIAGLFENKLASIFENVKTMNCKPEEFEAVYQLWEEYAKSDKKDNNAYLIKSFYGYWFYYFMGRNKTDNLTIGTDLKSSGSYLLNWNLEMNLLNNLVTKIKQSTGSHNTYMFNEPNTLKLPTKQQIKECWKNLYATNQFLDIKPTTTQLQADKPLTLTVKFGPVFYKDGVPDDNPTIEIDKQYWQTKMQPGRALIKDVRLIKDKIKINGLYYDCEIEIDSDNDALAEIKNINQEAIPVDLNLRLFHRTGTDSLCVEYHPVKLEIELLPKVIKPDHLEIARPEHYGNNYKYVVPVKILPVSNSYYSGFTINDTLTKVTKYDGIDVSTEGYRKIIARFKPGTGADAINEYQCTLTIPKDSVYYFNGNPEHDIEINVHLKKGTRNYDKPLKFYIKEFKYY
ncbi:hypothetical protein AGMMS50239_03060 [Bacteroidia bacterium]|nr:hypothetical protein AGMMS50239_03060 [Bacteroidia bacterium]